MASTIMKKIGKPDNQNEINFLLLSLKRLGINKSSSEA